MDANFQYSVVYFVDILQHMIIILDPSIIIKNGFVCQMHVSTEANLMHSEQLKDLLRTKLNLLFSRTRQFRIRTCRVNLRFYQLHSHGW